MQDLIVEIFKGVVVSVIGALITQMEFPYILIIVPLLIMAAYLIQREKENSEREDAFPSIGVMEAPMSYAGYPWERRYPAFRSNIEWNRKPRRKKFAPMMISAIVCTILIVILHSIFSSPFEDVAWRDYYFPAVKWVYHERITTGTDKTHFSPNACCTHEHMLLFLKRASEEQFNASQSRFSEQAEQELKALISDEITCTRGEAIVYLWLVVQRPKYVHIDRTSSLRDYYWDAVRWAIQNKITTKKSLEDFSPHEPCLRKDAVTFLYRARNLL